MKAFTFLTAVLLTLSLLSTVGRAAIFEFDEMGDAGDLPGTAQSTGIGDLSAVRGTLDGVDDIDLFAIFITDLSLFSATTVSPYTEFIDTQLFLFDEGGFGVAANDDTEAFIQSNATIPLGALSGGPGLYYLAVAEFLDKPVSVGGKIFADDWEGVVGPTGDGGSGALIGWDLDTFSESSFFPFPAKFEIILTGAQGAQVTQVIPEPSTLTAVLILFPLAAAYLCRKKGRS